MLQIRANASESRHMVKTVHGHRYGGRVADSCIFVHDDDHGRDNANPDPKLEMVANSDFYLA